MRFTKEKKIKEAYSNRTRKTKTKFLWWPVTIGGETRWFETATIEYRVSFNFGLFVDRYYYWEPFSFIEE